VGENSIDCAETVAVGLCEPTTQAGAGVHAPGRFEAVARVAPSQPEKGNAKNTMSSNDMPSWHPLSYVVGY